MRLHTDTINYSDFYHATRDLPGVYATVTEHGSRSRKRAYEVKLEGNGYARNSGQYGADTEYGATWDEWGVIIARLFDIDPNAFWGSKSYPVYRNSQHFHAVTNWRFEDLAIPADTHRRHNWDGMRTTGFQCTKCSALYFPGN